MTFSSRQCRPLRTVCGFCFVLNGLSDEGNVALQASKQEQRLAQLSCDTHRANVGENCKTRKMKSRAIRPPAQPPAALRLQRLIVGLMTTCSPIGWRLYKSPSTSLSLLQSLTGESATLQQLQPIVKTICNIQACAFK